MNTSRRLNAARAILTRISPGPGAARRPARRGSSSDRRRGRSRGGGRLSCAALGPRGCDSPHKGGVQAWGSPASRIGGVPCPRCSVRRWPSGSLSGRARRGEPLPQLLRRAVRARVPDRNRRPALHRPHRDRRSARQRAHDHGRQPGRRELRAGLPDRPALRGCVRLRGGREPDPDRRPAALRDRLGDRDGGRRCSRPGRRPASGSRWSAPARPGSPQRASWRGRATRSPCSSATPSPAAWTPTGSSRSACRPRSRSGRPSRSARWASRFAAA